MKFSLLLISLFLANGSSLNVSSVTAPAVLLGYDAYCDTQPVGDLISIKCTRRAELTIHETNTCSTYIFEREVNTGPTAAEPGPNDSQEICTSRSCDRPASEATPARCEVAFGGDRLAEIRSISGLTFNIPIVKNFVNDGHCTTSNSTSNGVVVKMEKNCYRTAYYTSQINDDCKMYRYVYKYREVIPVPENASQDPNNGKEICAFKWFKCTDIGAPGPKNIECSEAFSPAQLEQIRQKGNE